MPQERENAQDMFAGEAENVLPVAGQQENAAETAALETERTGTSDDIDDTSAFAQEMAKEVYESLSSMYEGQTLYEAVGDEANRLRIEGNADAAQALERIYEENRNGGNENGDGIGAWSERDVGESAGGEARTVAESAGRDQGRNIQAGRTEAGRAEGENPETGRKIKLSQFGIRNVDQNQTLTEITDTSTDPEVVEIGNIARRYGYEAHVVREQIRTKNGTLAGGVYKNGVIIVSVSDPTFSVTQLFNHELFHAIRKDTPEIIEAEMMLILNNMTDPEWDALLEAYQQLYAGLDMDDEDIFEEICADLYAGMMREQLAAARRANLPRLTEAARSIAYERSNVIPAEARSKNQTRAGPGQTKTAAGSDAGDGRYSVVDDFYEKSKAIETGTLDRGENPFVYISRSTPEILQEYAGAEDLPIIISYESLYLAIRESGELRGHYHNLGASKASEIVSALNKPDMVLRLENGRINEILSLTDKKGKTILVSVELNAVKDFNGKYQAYNLVMTMFGAGENYVRKLQNNPKNTILYQKNKAGEPTQVNPRLNELSGIINAESSTSGDSISDPAPSVNPRFPMSSPVEQTDSDGNALSEEQADPRFSISDDTTQRLQERADEIEQQIEKTRALMGEETDPATFGELEQLRTERTAIYSELDDRLRREARKAAREEDGKRAAQLEQIRLVEDHAKELSREANAERAAYKADGNADHLVNAERLRGAAAYTHRRRTPSAYAGHRQ